MSAMHNILPFGIFNESDIVIYLPEGENNGKRRLWRPKQSSYESDDITIVSIERESDTFKTNRMNLVRFSVFKDSIFYDEVRISEKSLDIYNKQFKKYTTNVTTSNRFDNPCAEIPLTKSKKEIKRMSIFNTMMRKNSEATKNGAVVTTGKTLNGVIKNKIRNQVPRKYRKMVDHPFADIVVANIAMLAIQNFAQSNTKANVAANAMLDAAMIEFFNSFNVEKIINEVIDGVNIDALIDSE